MTTLVDEVVQDYSLSPRATIVRAPRTAFIAQDVVDTLRKIEDSFRGQSETRLLDASGKQDLGGGVQVGITYQLQNDQIQFEDRDTPVYTGSITTPSGTPVGGKISVIDSGATFISDGVQRGSFVINWTDRSIISVQDVVSETELLVRPPTGGIGNTYDAADVISVFNVDTCDLSGGNATAVNDVAAAIRAVVPSVGTYAVLALSSSATIVESVDAAALVAKVDDIHGMVARSIWVDTTAGVDGDGYQQTPFNNFTSAATYAVANGIKRIMIEGTTATIDRNLVRYVFTGVGNPTVDMAGRNLNGCEFYACTLDGSMIGRIHAHDCDIEAGVSGLDGEFIECRLNGTITLGGSANVDMYRCSEGSPVTLVLGAGNSTVHIHGFTGNLTLDAVNGVGDEVHVWMDAGTVTINATCTNGSITVHGEAKITDNSAGTTVDKTGLIVPTALLTVKKFLGLK